MRSVSAGFLALGRHDALPLWRVSRRSLESPDQGALRPRSAPRRRPEEPNHRGAVGLGRHRVDRAVAPTALRQQIAARTHFYAVDLARRRGRADQPPTTRNLLREAMADRDAARNALVRFGEAPDH